VNEWGFVSKIIRKKVWEATDDKSAFISLTGTWQEYSKNKSGEPGYVDQYVNLLAYGATAEAMENIEEGSVIYVLGKPQAGRPYKNNDGEYVSSLEVRVERWNYVPRAGSKSSSEEGGGSVKKSSGVTSKKTVVSVGKKSSVATTSEEDEDIFN
jgi:hypothetical protein